MAFYYLLLGHLTGDFVLQTDKIAEYKGRQWKWNLLHVLVVTLCIFVFSFSFGILLNLLVLLNGVVHFILDYYKNEIRKIFHLSELACFLFDQMIHILFLFIISQVAVSSDCHTIDITAIKFLIVLVLVTSFSAVFTQFILGAVFPRPGGRFFEDGEKFAGILTRLYVSVVFYVSFTQSPYYLVLLLIAASSFFLQYKFGWNKWMSLSHLCVKLLLDILISAACILFVIL
jgi:hypothetical protein